MSLLQLLQAPRARRLMDVLIALPRLGVGARVTRASWAPYGDSFWDVTSVKPVDDTCADAKVLGVRTWRGVREPGERPIAGATKRVWKWVPTTEDRAALAALAKEAAHARVRVASSSNAAAGSDT